MLTLDPTTLGEFDTFIAAGDRAQAVLAALANPVTVRVYNGSGQVMGQGTMSSPWATRADGTLTVGALSAFQVLVSGVPDPASWYLRFESGSRWLQGTFGLAASGADFRWSLASWSAGQNGQIGAITTTAYDVPIEFGWTFAQGEGETYALNVSVNPGGTVVIPSNLYAIPVGQTAAWSLVGRADGTTITPQTVAGEPVVITVGAEVPATSSYAVTVNLASSAEQDWLTRSGGAGVVLAHDFRYEDEFRNFHRTAEARNEAGTLTGSGASPDVNGNLGVSTMSWQNSTPFAGASSKFIRASAPNAIAARGYHADTWFTTSGVSSVTVKQPGQSDITYGPAQAEGLGLVGSGGWQRPLFPLSSGNGLPTADPAAGGTITRVAWNPNNTQELVTWRDRQWGFWAHPDYASQFINTSPVGAKVIGNEFWLQFRVRFSADRNAPRADVSGGLSSWESGGLEFPPGGKLLMLDTLDGSEQEIVLFSGYVGEGAWYYPQQPPLRWYTNYGTQGTSSISGQTVIQPGSQWAATCINGGSLTQPNQCWTWPMDEWVTVLVHVIPGHHLVKDTRVEIKVARWGETSYTTVWDDTFAFNFEQNTVLYGWSSIAFNAYMNLFPSFRAFHHDYTQVILSTQEIPCPTVY